MSTIIGPREASNFTLWVHLEGQMPRSAFDAPRKLLGFSRKQDIFQPEVDRRHISLEAIVEQIKLVLIAIVKLVNVIDSLEIGLRHVLTQS